MSLLKPVHLEPMLHNKSSSPHNEKSMHHNEELTPTRESPNRAIKNQMNYKSINIRIHTHTTQKKDNFRI